MEHGRKPQRLVHDQVVVGAGAIGAQRHGRAACDQGGDRRGAGTDLHVAFGVVHHDRAAGGEALDIGRLEPDRMGAGQKRAEQAQPVQVLDHGAAVQPSRVVGLDAGFQQMGVDAQAVPLGKLAAQQQRIVRTALRIGRRGEHRQAAVGAVPARDRALHHRAHVLQRHRIERAQTPDLGRDLGGDGPGARHDVAEFGVVEPHAQDRAHARIPVGR